MKETKLAPKTKVTNITTAEAGPNAEKVFDAIARNIKDSLRDTADLNDISKDLSSTWSDLAKAITLINKNSDILGDNFDKVTQLTKDIYRNIDYVGTEYFQQINTSKILKDIVQEQLQIGKDLAKDQKEFHKNSEDINDLIEKRKQFEIEANKEFDGSNMAQIKKNKLLLEQADKELAILAAKQTQLDLSIEAKQETKERLKYEREVVFALDQANTMLVKANEHAKELGFNFDNATRTVTGKLEKSFDFLEEVPFLSDVLGLDSIKEKIEKSVKDSLVSSIAAGKGPATSMFSAMTAGASTLIATMAPLLPLIIAAYALYKAFEFDKELTQFSKDLDVSKDTAMGLSIEADAIAGSLGVAGVNGVEVGKAMATIKNEMGTTAALANKELVGAVSLLQTRVGLTGEEAMALNSTATLLGTNLNDLAASSYDMADGLIGGKEMLKEMAKLPKSLVVGFKGTTKELQKAIVKGKLFGLTIEQAQKAGEGMLEIETSLQKEMTFNILAGKSMNLNKARQLALEGKTAELQDEILSQAGSLEEYQKMGPLQQKAMADALNMSKEELTEMLTKTQEMADVGLSQAAVEEQMKKSLEDQQSTIDGMNDEKKKAYLQDLLNKKKQEEATAKFGDAMTKLTEAFQKTMMPVVEILGTVLGFIGDIISGITHMIEYFNHWTHSTKTVGDKTVEVKNTFGEILSVVGKIGAGLLALVVTANLIKKAGSGIGGMIKNILPGGGGKATEAASSATGSADQLKGAKEGKNKVSQLLDGIKNIIDSIKGVVQSAIQFVRDVGKDLINTVKDLFNGVVDLVRSVGTNVLSTLQELIGGIGKILADGTDIIVNVGSKLAEGAMKILNIIIQGLGKAAAQLPAIMSALGSAVVAFFTPMAALVPLAPAIAIFTGAMIGLGYAFKLLGEGIGAAAPGIQAFFDGMGGVIEAVGNAIAKVIETITTSIIRLQDIDPARLMSAAGGIVAIGAAIAGFGAGAGAGGALSALGSLLDEDPAEKFNRFATIEADKLITVAGAINSLGSALNNFSEAVSNIGDVSGIIDTIDKVMELHDVVSENPISEAVEGVASAVGDIFAKAASFVTSSAPEASSVTTSTAAPAEGGAAAAAPQGSLKEVADLLKQILSATSQPVSISIGGKVIDEIGKQTTLRKTYSTKIDTAHGAFG